LGARRVSFAIVWARHPIAHPFIPLDVLSSDLAARAPSRRPAKFRIIPHLVPGPWGTMAKPARYLILCRPISGIKHRIGHAFSASGYAAAKRLFSVMVVIGFRTAGTAITSLY